MSELLFRDSERVKYERVWDDSRYRTQTDGLPAVFRAFRGMGCKPGETLIDWGCGTGRAAKLFADKGLQVTCFDIAANAMDSSIELPFVQGCLWEPPDGLEADYGFCADVLEHIPPDYIEASLSTIYWRSKIAAFIQVDTVRDISGALMEPPEVLHLCVRKKKWWQDQLEAFWSEVIPSQGAFTRWQFLCGR